MQKKRHFLLPPGGAMIISHDFSADVFRSWLLSYVCSLESIGTNMSEIQNLVFWWRLIKLWRHATVTRCDEKLIFLSQLFSPSCCDDTHLNLKLIWWKPWDKYVKVKMVNMVKMATKSKMAGFLFDLTYQSKRLICLLWKDTCPHRFLYMSANRSAGAAL